MNIPLNGFLQLLLWILGLLHLGTPILIITRPGTIWRKSVWLAVVLCVPLLGPLYYLLFRCEYESDSPKSPDPEDSSETDDRAL